MKARWGILLVSVSVNVALATAIFRSRTPEPVANAPVAPQPFRFPKAPAPKQSTPAPASETETNNAAVATALFNWSELEADDYREYIARLRALGCPERVIRDIIIAEISKLYRPKLAALLPPKDERPYWQRNEYERYDHRGRQTKEQREQTRALEKEQDELIKSLLGQDVFTLMRDDWGEPDGLAAMLGKLSKEQREIVERMYERFSETQQEFHTQRAGYYDEEDQREGRAIQRKFIAELATVLTPEQIEQYELRQSDVAQNLSATLQKFDPNEAEFRALFSYKRTLADLQDSRSNDEPDARQLNQQLGQPKKEAEQLLAQVLPADRLKEFKLYEDYSTRQLLDAGLPKEDVFKVADMKHSVEDAAGKIRRDKSLSTEQRNAALQAIYDETAQELTGVLGERRAKAYQTSGGWWLRNVKPPPPKTSGTGNE
ncbi:MAG TPA: hypothetical protein VI454_10155 [Verrucomicrobiae bacterium]|jgi:hypothetical protein